MSLSTTRGIQLHGLVDRVDPPEGAQAAEQLRAQLRVEIIRCVILQLIRVAHLHDFGVGRKILLQQQKFPAVLLVEYLIRVGGIDVLHRRFRKREIPRGGKITVPRKIEDFCSVPRSDCFCAVGRAGIGNHDFVRNTGEAVEAAGQNRFLILYDHAHADGYHATPSRTFPDTSSIPRFSADW